MLTRNNIMLSMALHLMIISAVLAANGIGASVMSPVKVITVMLLPNPEYQSRQDRRIETIESGKKPRPAAEPAAEAVPAKKLYDSPVIQRQAQRSGSDESRTGREDDVISLPSADDSGWSISLTLPSVDRGIADLKSFAGSPVAKGEFHQVRDYFGAADQQTAGRKSSDKINEIRRAIDNAKLYPVIAKKRGIEGTAFLEFTINGRGQPENIRIAKSSGSEVLDGAALKTIDAAAPFPVVAGVLEIPIVYRIER